MITCFTGYGDQHGSDIVKHYLPVQAVVLTSLKVSLEMVSSGSAERTGETAHKGAGEILALPQCSCCSLNPSDLFNLIQRAN